VSGPGSISRTRLAVWAAFVAAVGLLNLAARLTGGKPAPDVLYHYDTAASGVVLYAIVLGVMLLLTRGLDRVEVFALSRPPSWPAAVGTMLLGFVAVAVATVVLGLFLHAGKEQGLVPDRWEPSHAGAFATNFAVIAIVAPVVEELTFRGFGVSALEGRIAPWATAAWVGVAFGAWHGLVIAFPALAALGAIFAAVRLRTRSVYPTMIMHGIFNGVMLLAAVAGAAS